MSDSITASIGSPQTPRIREAMLQLRADRTEKVQRIMQKIADREPSARAAPATDPTGNRGNTIDVIG